MLITLCIIGILTRETFQPGNGIHKHQTEYFIVSLDDGASMYIWFSEVNLGVIHLHHNGK